mmetsp:Transcript_19526/g.55148  ORF Transcript_19526/g.55148 Transcript_19526/m.55148 type:complete len:265 (+) Transcript_19526:82-876(+)|eukprot:CAMPEP_0119556324 /NCGR_PEP_ID=MMETSP1352-20130426/8325_1 /TAXON_ID=265584 /ORGANISM="Stauroneis constricta, Strain CCMP1120" /LENGTH=264 /DNA_ID=CAMNT_0007603267 /DNA_START=75 /DNA_END=869 /DNA_ORIENTATION=+
MFSQIRHVRAAAQRVASSNVQKQAVRSLGTAKSFHLNSPKNNSETYFDFTDENYERANRILKKYPNNYRQAAMIPLLDLAQRQHGGWLPLAAMEKVAQICNVAPVRVYEVASFYTMFNRTPVGKYFLQVCGTTPCMICGSEEIMQTISGHLGIKNGETTKDGLFTLLEVECLGACANAPMVQINDDYFECLNKETTIELLELAKQDKLPEMGKWGSLPMNGQVSCEGPLGKTSLFGAPQPPTVDPERFKAGEVDPASVKTHMAY